MKLVAARDPLRVALATEEPSTRLRRCPRRWPAWLALFGVTFVVHVTSPNAVVADSLRTIPVAESIIQRRTISLDHYRSDLPSSERRWAGPLPVPGYGVDEANGHYYPSFPWAVSLFAVPVVAAYDAAHGLGFGPGVEARALAKNTDWEFQVVAMSYVVALATVLMYEVGLALLSPVTGLSVGRRRTMALATALTFSLGTAAWSTASRSAWQHGPSMLLLTLAALLAVRSRNDPRAVRWLGLPVAAAYAVRPTNAIPLVLFGLWVLVAHRRQLPRFVLGASVVLAPFALVNLSAWGRLLPPYYSGNRLGGNRAFFEALAGNLVSPARGLLVFSPILVLAVVGVVLTVRHRRLDSLDLVLVGCVGAHWVAISTFPHWWGGNSFGPRLFSDMVPFLIVLAAPVVRWLAAPTGRPVMIRAAAAGCTVLLAASVFINFQGAYLRSSGCWNNLPTEVDLHPDRLWDWRDPQFLRGIRRLAAGPDGPGEVVRGGVAAVGCPVEQEG